jgi:hypothetical protein
MARYARLTVEQVRTSMIFVYRAAIVALATFASALIGFGVQWILPAAYAVEAKGMTGSIVGLVASLLSLVLGLLIWTSHGLFTTQQSQLQTIVRSGIILDFTLKEYGAETARARALLREHLKRARARFWDASAERRRIYFHAELPADILAMRAFVISLRPANEEQRQHLATVRDLFGTIVETQFTMIRTLTDPVPDLLLHVVLGWACLLFFGYGLLSAIDPVTIVLAACGAMAVSSAIFLILELSDPYTGLFRMTDASFSALVEAFMEDQETKALPRGPQPIEA